MSAELVRQNGNVGMSMMEQAEVLSRSNLVPKAFRGKPADVVVATLLGQELGLGPMATMSYIDVIEGNATVNAEGKVALVRRQGHSIGGDATATKATARGRRKDTGDEMAVDWTIQMAARAGLANKPVWKQYPESMLWSRAVSQLCRMLFPDVLVGLSYTPEEVEAFTAPTVVAAPADPETGEVIEPRASSRRRPPPGQEQPVPSGAHRNECTALHGTLADIKHAAPASREALVSMWRAKFPDRNAHDLAREEMPTAWDVVRQMRVRVAADSIGLADDDDRLGWAQQVLGREQATLAVLTDEDVAALEADAAAEVAKAAAQ